MVSVNTKKSEGFFLADNITTFGGVLRRAGMNVGTASVVDAIEATKVVGVGNKNDLYWTLHSVMVNRHEDQPTFDEAFRLFFGNQTANQILTMMSPTVEATKPQPKAAAQRVAEAMRGGNTNTDRERVEVEADASLSMSSAEVLNKKDFAQMTTEELNEAKNEIKKIRFNDDKKLTRRYVTKKNASRFDVRSTMRHSMKYSDLILPRFKTNKVTSPPIVALADISGSMSEYTRILICFLHALSTQRQVHTFLFGTRLTNITRALKHKDPDEALQKVSEQVLDWEGGTRIGQTLRLFNRTWGRRVLGQGAIVLFVSDGLERANDEAELNQLRYEAARLKRSAKKLIWLNPLLRFDKFEPKAAGIKTLLPNVDELKPIHSLDSINAICEAISKKTNRSVKNRSVKKWATIH